MRMTQIEFEKVDPAIVKENRVYYRKRVKIGFVRWCYQQGMFDRVFNERELENAKKGFLPKYLGVHHIRPLSSSKDGAMLNSFDNLCVITHDEHNRINKMIFEPQLKAIENEPIGTKIMINIPLYDNVDEQSIRKYKLEKEARNNKLIREGKKKVYKHFDSLPSFPNARIISLPLQMERC